MRKIRFLIISFSFFTMANASVDIKIKVLNLSRDTVRAFINVSDNPGSTQSNNIFVLKLLPNRDTTVSAEITKYCTVSGFAIFNKGGKTAEKFRVVAKDNDNFTLEITVPDESVNQSLTDLTNSGKILEYDPSKFMDLDASPKPIEGLFSEYLGGLVAFCDSNAKMNIKTIVSPTDLKIKAKVGYGTASSSQEIAFVNQNSQAITASIPAIAQLGVIWDNSSLYNVKIEYNKIGVIDYLNNGINLSKAINDLNQDALYNLGYLKFKYPKLRLKQINQAYVFEAVYIEVNQGNGFGFSQEVGASTFFTNKGNFKMSRTALNKKVFGNSYLGFWCSSLSQDVTSSLDLALAVYSSVSSVALVTQNEGDVLKNYADLRKNNSNLPDLKSKQDIVNFFKSQVDRFKGLNPDIAMSPLFQNLKVGPGDLVNQLSDSQIKEFYEALKLKTDGLPEKYERNAAKLYIKALDGNLMAHDANIEESLKRLNQEKKSNN